MRVRNASANGNYEYPHSTRCSKNKLSISLYTPIYFIKVGRKRVYITRTYYFDDILKCNTVIGHAKLVYSVYMY